jgi:hypothetical protein
MYSTFPSVRPGYGLDTCIYEAANSRCLCRRAGKLTVYGLATMSRDCHTGKYGHPPPPLPPPQSPCHHALEQTLYAMMLGIQQTQAEQYEHM